MLWCCPAHLELASCPWVDFLFQGQVSTLSTRTWAICLHQLPGSPDPVLTWPSPFGPQLNFTPLVGDTPIVWTQHIQWGCAVLWTLLVLSQVHLSLTHSLIRGVKASCLYGCRRWFWTPWRERACMLGIFYNQGPQLLICIELSYSTAHIPSLWAEVGSGEEMGKGPLLLAQMPGPASWPRKRKHSGAGGHRG